MTDAQPARGLTHLELVEVVDELDPLLREAIVEDAALLRGCDDLLLILNVDDRKRKLQVAPGGNRARLCTTSRRFRRDEFATGPNVDLLRSTLTGRVVTGCRAVPGERRCTLVFAGDPPLQLEVELFGPRGLWCLVDQSGVIIELSRPVQTKTRTLRRGDRYDPPPPGPKPPGAPPSRFKSPVLDAVDAMFTALDRLQQANTEVETLSRAIERGRRKTQARVDGLRTQQREIARSDELRREADLMLAYAHEVARGARSMSVPDPGDPAARVEIALDPTKPLHAQAKGRYARARKLEESAVMAEQRLGESEAWLEELDRLAQRCVEGAESATLVELRAGLEQRGLLPKPAAPSDRRAQKEKKITAGENFRRFESAEGYPILIGRNNAQNDRLSLRVARGNDLWFHVGGGRAGSHVVVRLPKGKTASLETMLDAGTLAIHFSKARGERLCDVLYTKAKHVRKPKGLPPGRVVPAQTRTLGVRLDDDRLRRLLDSTPND